MSMYRKWDGMRWPVPGEDMDALLYRLAESWHKAVNRNDRELGNDINDASLTIQAYVQLVKLTQERRNEIIREIRKGPNT